MTILDAATSLGSLYVALGLVITVLCVVLAPPGPLSAHRVVKLFLLWPYLITGKLP